MRVGLGEALSNASQLDEAVGLRVGQVLDRRRPCWDGGALTIDSQNADIHDSRGDALLAQGRRAEAVAE